MRKMLFIILTVAALSVTGCSARPERPQKPLCRVVTEITVLENSVAGSRLFHYSDPKALTKMLTYIRHLDPWDPVPGGTDPVGDVAYTITVHLSDGTRKNYEQIGLTQFRAPGDVWRQIPQEHGIRLPLLVEAIK